MIFMDNISAEQWMNLKTRGDIPSPRDGHSTIDQCGEFLNDLFMYNPKTSIWIYYNKWIKGKFICIEGKFKGTILFQLFNIFIVCIKIL